MDDHTPESGMEVWTPLALCVPSTPAEIGDSTMVSSLIVGDDDDNHDDDADDDVDVAGGDGRAMVAMPTSL